MPIHTIIYIIVIQRPHLKQIAQSCVHARGEISDTYPYSDTLAIPICSKKWPQTTDRPSSPFLPSFPFPFLSVSSMFPLCFPFVCLRFPISFLFLSCSFLFPFFSSHSQICSSIILRNTKPWLARGPPQTWYSLFLSKAKSWLPSKLPTNLKKKETISSNISPSRLVPSYASSVWPYGESHDPRIRWWLAWARSCATCANEWQWPSWCFC